MNVSKSKTIKNTIAMAKSNDSAKMTTVIEIEPNAVEMKPGTLHIFVGEMSEGI